MIKWGIIGLGNMGQKFASAIIETDNSKLIGVASKDKNKIKKFKDNFKFKTLVAYNDYDEIIKDKNINAIYIATLNNTHFDLIKNFENKKECIQNLKPYANVLFNKIRETNSNDDIIIEDKFYPNEKFPKISFNIETRTFNKKKGNLTILTIGGHCKDKGSYISLNAPLLKPSYEVFSEIEQKIRDKKKLNIKENFDKEAKEQEKSIDTQGLQ